MATAPAISLASPRDPSFLPRFLGDGSRRALGRGVVVVAEAGDLEVGGVGDGAAEVVIVDIVGELDLARGRRGRALGGALGGALGAVLDERDDGRRRTLGRGVLRLDLADLRRVGHGRLIFERGRGR